MRLLDLTTLTSLVSSLPRFGRVSYLAGVDSTNAVAVDRLYSNDSFGISFVTESQAQGRGRAGRSWFSPAGAGVYVSTILPADLRSQVLPAVGFWASLAVREACLKETGVALDLKWPNDLVWHDRKCVGILSQSRGGSDVSRVVVGVGINVNRPAEVAPEIAQRAVWLSEIEAKEFDRTRILATLLSIYERGFDRLVSSPDKVIDDWARVAKLEGSEVAVKATDGKLLHAGKVTSVAADGALVLQTEHGPACITLGDVDAL
jgi:BirA family transcriptional regulator, biotin operon repressor / biotin---[acetyl-CoA-carboxylase] ligase